MKRNMLVTSILVLVLVPAFALAADANKFVMSKAQAVQDELVVPLEITNSVELAALDIPLKYSEGAVLDRVEFTDRVETFEFKYASIDNENHTVVIGLISMVTGDRPDLAVGSGAVANLVFKTTLGDDEIQIEAVELKNPDHSLSYYYNDYSNGRPEVKSVNPDVDPVTISYSPGPAVPVEFALRQNSPNPFNPVTKILYDLAAPGDVQLSVFNVLGQHVTDLVNGYQEAGQYSVTWDGKDKYDNSAASGIYFYRIKTNEFTETKKMVLLK